MFPIYNMRWDAGHPYENLVDHFGSFVSRLGKQIPPKSKTAKWCCKENWGTAQKGSVTHDQYRGVEPFWELRTEVSKIIYLQESSKLRTERYRVWILPVLSLTETIRSTLSADRIPGGLAYVANVESGLLWSEYTRACILRLTL